MNSVKEILINLVWLLRKDVYAYQYMESQKKFDETSLSDRKEFYSCLNMEDITDVDHRHAKEVFKYFTNNCLGDYHHLYVQSHTLLLADRLKTLEVWFLKYVTNGRKRY